MLAGVNEAAVKARGGAGVRVMTARGVEERRDLHEVRPRAGHEDEFQSSGHEVGENFNR